MIKNVLFGFFFFELCIAVGISLYWLSNNIPVHQVSLGSDFLSFINSCSRELSSFKIEIPQIPKIQPIGTLEMESVDWWNAVLNFFIQFANGFFAFLNGVTTILNFVIMALNTLIQLLQFIFIVIKNSIVFKDNIASTSTSSALI